MDIKTKDTNSNKILPDETPVPQSGEVNDLNSNEVLEQYPGNPKRKIPKKVLYALGGVIVVLLGAFLYWFFFVRESEEPEPRSAVQESEPALSENLLTTSQNINGFSIGYIKADAKPEHESSGLLNNKVFAQSETGPDYTTSVFYSKESEGLSQIFSYDVEGKSESQVSDGKASAYQPVFSSASQRLAYQEEGEGAGENQCDLVIKSFETDETHTFSPTDGEDSCLLAVNWSPDGTSLVLNKIDYSNDAVLGEISLHVVSIKDGQKISEADIKEVPYPSGFDTHSDVVGWLDENTLGLVFALKAPFGEFKNSEYRTLDITDFSSTRVDGQEKVDVKPENIFIDGVGGYGYHASNTFFVPLDNLTPSAGRIIATGKNVLPGLVKYQTGENMPQQIIYSSGEVGVEEDMKLNSYDVSNKKSQVLVTPPGSYSSYPIGWTSDYQSVIYGSSVSGAFEVRMFELDNPESDRLLIGDLNLVQ